MIWNCSCGEWGRILSLVLPQLEWSVQEGLPPDRAVLRTSGLWKRIFVSSGCSDGGCEWTVCFYRYLMYHRVSFFYFQVLCVSFSMRARWDSGSATPKDLMRRIECPDVENPAWPMSCGGLCNVKITAYSFLGCWCGVKTDIKLSNLSIFFTYIFGLFFLLASLSLSLSLYIYLATFLFCFLSVCYHILNIYWVERLPRPSG